MSVQIITNYTPASHILCGEALKETYANFRIEVLREVDWATWHGKLKRLPGGKGWCIRKAHLLNLTSALDQYSIPYTISEFIPAPVAPTTIMPVQIAHQLGNGNLPSVKDADDQPKVQTYQPGELLLPEHLEHSYKKALANLDFATRGAPTNGATYQ